MATTDKSSAIRFLEANLRKGYSQQKLSEMLAQRGFKRDTIDDAFVSINHSRFEQEAIAFISSIIDKHLAQGDSPDRIIDQLESKGIDHALVTKALSRLRGERITPSHVPHLSKTTWIILACVGAGILVAGIVLTFYEPTTPEGFVDCGMDKDCFLRSAQLCADALLREDVAGSILSYRSTSGCTMIKRFESFGPSEPPEVVSFFKGTQMTCSYEQGQIPPELIQGLSGGLIYCSGDLKDAVIELQLAALALET